MFRTLVGVSFLCFATLLAHGQGVDQDSLSDPGAATTAACDCGSRNCGDCGDCGNAGIGCCGKVGGFFNKCSGQGCSSGCCESEGRLRGMVSRVGDLVPGFGRKADDGCCRYWNFFGGGYHLNDYSGDAGGAAPSPITGTFNDGFVLGWARGRYINDKTRVEIEGSWRNNTGNLWTNNMGTVPFDGQLNLYSSTFNIVREVLSREKFGLYAGGGIGYSVQDGDFTVNGNHFRFDDWAFAYQGFVGLNMFQLRRGKFYVEYKYLGNTQTQLEMNGVDFDNFNYNSQNVVFGVRLTR